MAEHSLLILITTVFLFLTVRIGISRGAAIPAQPANPEDIGLYDDKDKVIILTKDNFELFLHDQPYASLVQFYNSYCGHCKRFSPIYKEFAKDVWPWRDVVKTMAIDCAADMNNGICREYEIMGYPTMRYFSPHYQYNNSDYGRKFEKYTKDKMERRLLKTMIKENRTSNSWPNFAGVTEKEATNVHTHFSEFSPETQHILFVYEMNNSTIGAQLILTFNRFPAIKIRRVNDLDVAAKLQFDTEKPAGLAAIDRKGTIQKIPINEFDSFQAYKLAIQNFLKINEYKERESNSAEEKNPTLNLKDLLMAKVEAANHEKIVEYVRKNKHLVYQADLEQALHHLFQNEIPKIDNINGERFVALQNLTKIINLYNPLGENGKTVIKHLNDFVIKNHGQMSGQQFHNQFVTLKEKYDPIFSSSHYVGCAASKPGLRGFTCSLWQLFHYMTVQAANDIENKNPLDVMRAIHGFVKYFFGCTDCSEHFQEMATKRNIWNIPDKDEAILWLWEAHNEVNKRLAGDSTEDPKFPKIQFPNIESCPNCRTESYWNRNEVLKFLKTIHDPDNVSRFNVEHEEVLMPSLDSVRQKRLIGNVFSDMDMRMGVLLYAFCIVMIIIAFKLFAFKGYRKKPYGHDLLGKV